MCTEINKEYLETIHHEMGHIEYFMAYKNQPEVYRNGANCGFHEAIGDTIALSVMTRKHLKAIKLIPNKESLNEHGKWEIGGFFFVIIRADASCNPKDRL